MTSQCLEYSPTEKEIQENRLFNQWRCDVAIEVYQETGYNLDDLPDVDYRVNHDNGTTIANMTKIVLWNARDGGWIK